MKSIFDTTWKFKSVPERLILKQKQKYNISRRFSVVGVFCNTSKISRPLDDHIKEMK